VNCLINAGDDAARDVRRRGAGGVDGNHGRILFSARCDAAVDVLRRN
jgi:hypothetical protein